MECSLLRKLSSHAIYRMLISQHAPLHLRSYSTGGSKDNLTHFNAVPAYHRLLLCSEPSPHLTLPLAPSILAALCVLCLLV